MQICRLAFAATALALSTALAACTSGRTVITLPQLQIPPATNVGSSQRTVAVTVITDDRVFEDSPSEPSTPSLGLASASASAAEVKTRAVARKRNGYGQAQGDVILAEPLTVRQVVKASVEAAFIEAGVPVVPQGGSATPVQVHVKQFWLWLQPGVMVATVRSRVSVELSIGASKPFVITSETSQPGQIFSEESWSNAVALANAAFRKEAAARIATESR